MRKSQNKIKAEGTQEFFDKKKRNSFTFNKAPVNKDEAKKLVKTKVLEQIEKDEVGLEERDQKQRKRSAFVAKLYRDEEDLDELKILAGQDFDSEVDEEVEKPRKRDKKLKDKIKTVEVSSLRINKLKFEKGSVALFAVSEVHANQYAIVNHTRNVKGFISLKENPYPLVVGQLVVAMVTAIGTGTHNSSTSRNLNRKLQLSLDPKSINKGLALEKVTSGMLLQAIVESKEDKGYILNLGLKDGTKGFVKCNHVEAHLGSLVPVLVKSMASKLIKCELFAETNKTQTVQSDETAVTVHTLKPGYLVAAKVAKLFENGIELSFLGGMNGTVFADHLDKASISNYKVGEKLKARIISTDIANKTSTLSLLPHLISLKSVHSSEVGKIFTNAKVEKLAFGSSFLVRLDKEIVGFLHKSQIPQEEELEKDEDSKILEDVKIKKKKAKLDDDCLLKVGQQVSVRVKEFNYFDGTNILSMKSDVLSAAVLDYDTIKAGDFMFATIEKVNEVNKVITLKINDFVKGFLPIEHMADHPVKVVPPKLTSLGKSIKVRVFSIENRNIIFTKKESLMKEKTPIYAEPDLIKQGNKVVGFVAAQVEHGFVIRSFGGIKGLLKFDDIKKSKKVKVGDLKSGTIVKTYVLFNKKQSGLALTLDKHKSKSTKSESANDFLAKFGPNQDELQEILKNYSAMIKESSREDHVGKVFKFRCVENKGNYFLVKTVLSEKKNKIAILPKCLVSSFGISLPLGSLEFTFDGLILEHSSGIPVIAVKYEMIHSLESIPSKPKHLEKAQTHVGFVSQVCEKLGVTVRFFNGVQAQVAVKDLQSSDLQANYKLGQVVSVSRNKKGRLSLKSKVLHKSDPHAHEIQLQAQIKAFDSLFSLASENLSLKIGMKVKVTVQLVKDYGLIAAIEGHSDFTGFVVNEQKASGKHYKVGSVLECIVLDIDSNKKIADLSERLIESKIANLKLENQKAIVELNKEQYLIVSLKKARQQIGVCIPNDFTQVNKTELYARYQVGSEIEVKVLSQNNFVMTLPVESENKKPNKNLNLEEGSLVTGPLRSIKGHCLFIQVGSNGKVPTIGRLHRVECQSNSEFESFKVGDIIGSKVLKKSQDNGRTWIELTRRKQHMDCSKLDQSLLNLLAFETIPEGQVVEGIVTETVDAHATFIASSPINVQISAFIRTQLQFSDVLQATELTNSAVSAAQMLAKKYKVNQRISLVYQSGKFRPSDVAQTSFVKGDLVVVRFVKSIGFGVTVQLNEKTFGMIQLCELTDQVTANIAQAMSQKCIFVARIISTDKKGRLQLSSRESVLDQEIWKLIKPDGSSALFKQADAKRQSNGNYRNAILKYGAKLVLNQGDLVIGYVTTISKAGCFIQVGHETSIRAGLNELSDKQDFNFQKEMPIGRIVVARITKADQDNTRFHASLRQSLVVYGVNQIEWSTLKPDQTVSAIVLAIADGIAFGQLKGTYYKLKIKDVPSQITIGTIVQVKLLKVVKDKLSAKFVEIEPKEATTTVDRQLEHKSAQIYASIHEEAQKDIDQAAKLAKETKQRDDADLEQMIINQRSQTQLDEQIRDLEAIQEIEEEEQDVEMESESQPEDSDAEEMQRIISQSKVHDEDSDSDDEEGESDDEEGENEMDEESEVNSSEDEEMADNSDKEEAKTNKGKSGKSALRSQITQEKEIRNKEAEMRSKHGAQPKSISDFERLLIADQDQSFLWIQYMAFMLEQLDAAAARRVAERAVKSVSITAEADKLNIWIAFMNLENKFGTQQELLEVVKRAIEVNDRLKVYMQLIQIYRQSDKTEHVEDIYKMLCKKNFTNIDVWTSYIEFLFEARSRLQPESFTPAKVILQRALQALPKQKHINIISKFGMLEYKHGQPESGRTMFEGIVTNFQKRMDVWSIYMDMEVKYGEQSNARHLFERCLNLEEIKRKPKKIKLVFRKYMEFESACGNVSKVNDLRKRVEQYLETAFKQKDSSSSGEDSE